MNAGTVFGKEHTYFISGGVSVEHGGGILFAQDNNIMGWLFSQKKQE